MQEMITVTGMVLSQTPIGDYDRRVCILTKERGKISAFAKGARRQNSRLMASTNPFSFGQFKLYQGKTSYNIMEASIDQYFEGLRDDFVGAYYGMYFLEIADYYTRENNDEMQMLKLLYQSMRALIHPSIDNRLVRCIYEIKTVVVNGEFPGLSMEKSFDESTIYAVEYIVSSSIEKLYTFQVSEKVLLQLEEIGNTLRERFFKKEYKSLEILETLTL
ncbi:MAG: DNA repair protein RecO [Lachnospiraceae bacterium]|nr:DNA repair protein RecO [Lachnospiraceae bacterium]